ncbi:sterol desaturase family protein [Parvularcula sp. IMCC14364]|uniref:sterol desaturase family protein n=1 Tax=Parvularcula sp. IMCC14364 TaxID=3067902 RepID=UPI0027428E84|nr:sterol desaturase family protein [Parvularcula sp. IMCC14364]
MTLLVNTLIVLVSIVAMEGFAWLAHRYIMHGWGWGWHKSHHEPTDGIFEVNDLYAVVFGVFAMGLFMIGSLYWQPLWYIALGITIYGILYGFVHDGLVHQRWPFRYFPKGGYLRRLVVAHKLHHALQSREDCVSFGFLYAPDPKKLKSRLRASRSR